MEIESQNSIKQADFSTLSASEIELILVNNQLLLKQNAELKTRQSELEDESAELKNTQTELIKKINWFDEQFKLLKHKKFASSTEKLAVVQPQMFDELLIENEASAKADDSEVETSTRNKPQRKLKNVDTSHLPRERRVHDLSEEEKQCQCGRCLEKIGEEVKEVIEFKPASLKVIEHVRLKYTCRHCETIKTPPVIETPIPKSKASAGLLTEIILNKYSYHLPLYRQSKMFKPHHLEVPDNTLGGWVMKAADQLEPLGDALWDELNKTSALQADETPVKVLKPEKKAYMWLYHSYLPDKRFIIFDFSLGRSSEVVNARLKDFQGILQTDGYAGYNTQRKRADIISLGCWDHARRKFADVVKVCGKNKLGKAGKMLKKIGGLYDIERDIKHLSAEERKAIRQAKAKPKLEEIFEFLHQIHPPPKSLLSVAVTYCKNQWGDLTRYVDYGDAQLSNCWIENQVRPFAVGKRNWLFVGNVTSAARAALLYSLIQSCYLNDIDPRTYLEYVLGQVHQIRRKTVDPTSLLPHRIDKHLLQQ